MPCATRWWTLGRKRHDNRRADVSRAKRDIPDWIVMGPAPHFATCQRCGKAVPEPVLPMPVDALFAFMEYAGLLHARCKVGRDADA